MKQRGWKVVGKERHIYRVGAGFKPARIRSFAVQQKPKDNMSISVEISEMMETGAHFGHQTKRWNPKMRPFIYGNRSGVHIIDLQKTKELAGKALDYLVQAVGSGQDVLFVGTKVQARAIIKDNAVRCNMHYVNNRWMGGTLTNFKTIKKSIDKLIDFQTKRQNNGFEGYTKKELLDIDRQIVKLEASLGGIKGLTAPPDLVYIVDPNHEHIAVREAAKLHIPIVALTDSNCDPDPITYPIPTNDDAVGAITYFTQKIADACLAGLEVREQTARTQEAQEAVAGERQQQRPQRKRRVASGREAKETGKKTAYVDRRSKQDVSEVAVGEFSAKVEKDQEKPVETKVTQGDVETVHVKTHAAL